MLFATAVGKTPDGLIQQDNISLHIETQNGGSANNYVVHNGSDAALAAKDEVIAAKSEMIVLLQERIQDLEGKFRSVGVLA
ncbi:MAG: hypothetical protein ACKVUS_18270 [Saprospiraceae bacterium]